MTGRSSDYKLLSGLFFRLLPFQILLIVINAINGIVDGLYASNVIGETAMSAIGLYGPLNHFLYAGLCMEEMAGNVVAHGFAQDNKKHSADIRVIYSDGHLILRIRDNCKFFDPSQHAGKSTGTDDVSNIGIRLVYSLAEEVEYQNLLGMNVLTIRM